MANKRIDYLDCAKGLLILILLFHHIIWVVVDCRHIDNEYFIYWKQLRPALYMPYFMTTFFVITGMCTNWQKNFRDFWVGNVLTILVPSILLSFALQWFLCALFIAKTILWILINKVKNNKLIWFALITLSFSSSLLNEYFHQFEYLSIYHAFELAIYLYIGTKLKKYNISKLSMIGYLYIPIVILLRCYGVKIPFIEGVYGITYSNWLLSIALGVLGGFMVLSISQRLTKVTLLRFVGKYSLVIYLVHIHFVVKTVEMSIKLLEHNSHNCLLSVLLFIGIFAITLCGSFITIKLLDNKFGYYILGKI